MSDKDRQDPDSDYIIVGHTEAGEPIYQSKKPFGMDIGEICALFNELSELPEPPEGYNSITEYLNDRDKRLANTTDTPEESGFYSRIFDLDPRKP